MENDKNSQLDLDICDISGRISNSLANLVSQDEMESAVKELKNTLELIRGHETSTSPWPSNSKPGIELNKLSRIRIRSDEQTYKQWNKEYNYSYKLEVSPGLIKVSSQLANPERERLREKSPNYRSKTKIKEWSPKSRANMVARFSTLDYFPLVSNELQRPTMITLTYPDNWELAAPTGQHAKRHLIALKKRYERKFKTPLYALWKTEYQSRGAVHFHLLCAPPNSPEFRRWLSEAWADIVDHPLPDEKARHLLSGVHVSYDEKYSGFDSRSISVYFSKHAAPNRGSKEYQNTPPQLWKDEASIGRFWGYFGLKPLVWKIPLSYREAVCFSRTLRRFSSRGLPGQPKPMRTRVVYGQIYKNQATSRTGLLRRRVVKVPVKRFPTVLGFITVSNGARITRYLSRVLTLD